eukprot:TRINITY_DN2355_c0_g1_i3.p1 TRINITY_DN2355_c0_g1~~TRINITY_DN2355_c0_g1_i3.p1  ORF type:complete len:257 (-),score=20.29 TRINITY_DN2355_c0_g1_i3:231-1001(-)
MGKEPPTMKLQSAEPFVEYFRGVIIREMAHDGPSRNNLYRSPAIFNIDLENPPQAGKWSLKACEAMKIWKWWHLLAEILRVPDTCGLVEEITRMFVVLYTKDYDPTNPSDDWAWLLSNIHNICQRFESRFQLAKQSNYPHIVGHHTTKFLQQNLSLRFYSNTILETLLGSMKKVILTKTSRRDFLYEFHRHQTMRLFTAMDNPERLAWTLRYLDWCVKWMFINFRFRNCSVSSGHTEDLATNRRGCIGTREPLQTT